MNVCFVIHLSYLPLALVNGLFCRRFSQSVNKYSMNAPMIEWMDEKKKE